MRNLTISRSFHIELGHRGGIHRVDATSTSIFVILTPSTGGSRWIWKLFESILHRLKYRGGGFLVCGFKILIRFFDRKCLLLVFKSQFGWTSAQQLKNSCSISKITKKKRKSAIFSRKFHREDKISETYTSRGGSEVGDIIINSTAHPPSTSKSTPPRCIFWTHRGCSTPRWPSSTFEF